MNYIKLAKVVRDKAEEMQKMERRREPEGSDQLDEAELLNCLARILEGKEIRKAFGAPGDWGYGTPIGDALMAAYSGE